MASKSTKSDLAQILMLTLYLMAIFFACFGAFYHLHKVRRERAARDAQRQHCSQLERMLLSKEKRAVFNNWRLREEKKALAGKLDAEVLEIWNRVPNRPQIDNKSGGKPKPRGGIVERDMTIKFKPHSLRGGLIQFVHRVEVEAPHIEFSKVKFYKKSRKNLEEDSWNSEIRLVSYTAEEKAGGAAKPEGD